MINKNIFTKDIFEDARIRSERLKMISSLSSEKKWNELLNFVKNNQGGLIELTVLPIFQKFLFYFLILIPPIYLFFFNVAYQILITTCDSLDYQVNNIIIKTTLDYQDNFIIKTICSIWENIISEKNFIFLFLKNNFSSILDFLYLLWLSLLIWCCLSFKTLQIDVINQKILLKNFLGKTDKSFSFYELKNFYNFNIGKTRTKLLINPIFKNSPEEFSDNLDKYQFEIEIINKRNNKREGFYFVTRSFYPAEFLKFIFENIERI